jgi:putative ABC transport system ATP-binding protein
VVRVHVRPLRSPLVPDDPTMIALRGVRKVYGRGETEVCALDGVSLDVPAGQFVAVMGPSGSGKSTLLHLLGGLDQPTAGEIVVAGTPLAGMSDDDITIFRRRRIGFVFQFFNLLPGLTAEENVALPLLLDGRGRRAVQPAVEEALARVGLGSRRRHRPDELSGGEMQRVAIARALVIEPALILADEPTGNLDSRTGEQILALIRDANQRRGATVLLVTHDARAASYATRTVTMRDGTIVADTAA